MAYHARLMAEVDQAMRVISALAAPDLALRIWSEEPASGGDNATP